VSWDDLAEPFSDLSHDSVDLERLQKSRLLFQFGTPRLQDPVCSVFVVAALINHLLDGHFPFLKTHRLSLLISVSEEMSACVCQQEEANPGSKKRIC
jgi:hypothetical protein